jgi:hypothetical protein
MAEANESVVYFCPTCGGASLDFSELAGGASCRTCGWKGHLHERVAYPFKHDFLSGESSIHQLVSDMRVVVAASSKLYITLLLKWGFLTKGPGLEKAAARYLAAVVRATLTAFIEERDRIEQEKHGRERDS